MSMFHNPFNSKVVADITKFLNEHRDDIRIDPCLDEKAQEAARYIDSEMILEERRTVMRVLFNEAVGECGCKGTNNEATDFAKAVDKYVEEGKKLPPAFLKNIKKKKDAANKGDDPKKEEVEEESFEGGGESPEVFAEAKIEGHVNIEYMNRLVDNIEATGKEIRKEYKQWIIFKRGGRLGGMDTNLLPMTNGRFSQTVRSLEAMCRSLQKDIQASFKESFEEGEDRRPFDHLGEAKASSTIEFSIMSKDFDGMESAYDSLPRRLKSMQTGSGMALGSGMRDHGYECKSKSDMDAIVAHYKKKVKSLTVKKHSAESVEVTEAAKKRKPYEEVYYKWFSGVQVDIMDIGKIAKEIQAALDSKADLEKVMPELVKKYRKN